jgi:hypothetical protein
VIARRADFRADQAIISVFSAACIATAPNIRLTFSLRE